MRLAKLQTRTRIFGAFAVVSLSVLLIAGAAPWRMQSADAIARDLVDNKLARHRLTSERLGLARLNGVRTVSIARSDSLELGG